MDVYPSQKLIANLRKHGVNWREVVLDIETPQTVSPIEGYETRLIVRGDCFAAYVEPVIEDGRDAWLVVGVRQRTGHTGPIRLPVVGVETKPAMPRGRGGSGNRWPSTWEELGRRLRAFPGVVVRRGGKHVIVEKDGQVVETLPVTSSDHRALLNACTRLAKKGVDVSAHRNVGSLTFMALGVPLVGPEWEILLHLLH